MNAPVTVIRPTRGWAGLRLGELWRSRELLGFLVWRDVKVRYKQTLLGAAWAVLQPLLAMAVFTVFIHRLAGVSPDANVPYPIWSYTGLLAWTFFAQALERSSNSLIQDRALLTRVYFPRMVLPLSGTVSALVDLAVAFVMYAGMLVYYGIRPGIELAYLPAFLLLATAAAFGAGLWLSALNVKYRDVRHAIPFLIQVWLFASPVAYPSSVVPPEYRALYGLNPMSGAVEGFRWCLVGTGGAPGGMLWASVGTTAALLACGAVYFRRMERTFADIV